MASWYGDQFHGRPTASGETYDMEGSTGAHPTLPFGTRLRVENLDNGRSTTLTINDRGPFAKGRILDVSRRVARELGMLGPGTARVRITILEEHGMPDSTDPEAE
jgi:rare lipoprotein A